MSRPLHFTINQFSGSVDRSNFGSGDSYNAQNINSAVVSATDPDYEEICSWLRDEQRDLDFRLLQDDLFSQRQPDIGNWFLESDEFRNWLDGTHNTLFCHGSRGIGKTMLVALAVSHLQNIRSSGETTQMVLFCYLSRNYEHGFEAYLAALLAQVLKTRGKVCAITKDIYTYHKPTNSRPRLNQLVEVFLAEISDYTNVFILIDALDESKQQVRSDLVRKLIEIQTRHQNTRLLLTSYDVHTLDFQLARARLLELRIPSNELSSFLHTQMREKAAINSLIRDNQTREERLRRLLIDKAEGNVLIADQHLKFLAAAEPQTFNQLMTLANNLSPILEEVWGNVLREIVAQSGFTRINGQRVLVWLAATGRELAIDLVRHAIAFSEETETNIELDEDDLVGVRHLLISCRGLVQLRESSGTITFSHPTMFQFFQENINALGVQNAHAYIAQTCLRHLKWTDTYLAHLSLPSSAQDINQFIQSHPLLEYSLRQFSHHRARAADLLVDDAYETLFANAEPVDRIGSLLFWIVLPDNLQHDFRLRKASRLHMYTVLKLSDRISNLIETGSLVDIKDDEGWTSLCWAVVARDQDIIRLLVHLGSQLQECDDGGLTTSIWAFGESSYTIKISDLLMEENSRALIGPSFTLSPYSAQACELGALIKPTNTDVTTLKTLLGLSAGSASQDESERWMYLACQKRLGTVVTKLIEMGVAITSEALLAAINGSCVNIICENCTFRDYSKSVIGCHIRIDEAKWRVGGAPHERLELDEEWICQLVTEETVRSLGPRGRTPLSFAAEMGFPQVCKRLVECGADVNATDDDGWTPLKWALVRPKFAKVYVDNCVLENNATAILGAVIEITGSFSEQADVYQEHDWSGLAQRKVDIVTLLSGTSATLLHDSDLDFAWLGNSLADHIPGVAEVVSRTTPLTRFEIEAAGQSSGAALFQFSTPLQDEHRGWISIQNAVITDNAAWTVHSYADGVQNVTMYDNSIWTVSGYGNSVQNAVINDNAAWIVNSHADNIGNITMHDNAVWTVSGHGNFVGNAVMNDNAAWTVSSHTDDIQNVTMYNNVQPESDTVLDRLSVIMDEFFRHRTSHS